MRQKKTYTKEKTSNHKFNQWLKSYNEHKQAKGAKLCVNQKQFVIIQDEIYMILNQDEPRLS